MHTVFQTRDERRTGLSTGMVLRPPAAREFQSPGGHLKGWLSQRLISVDELRDIQDVEYQQSTYCNFEDVQSHLATKILRFSKLSGTCPQPNPAGVLPVVDRSAHQTSSIQDSAQLPAYFSPFTQQNNRSNFIAAQSIAHSKNSSQLLIPP